MGRLTLIRNRSREIVESYFGRCNNYDNHSIDFIDKKKILGAEVCDTLEFNVGDYFNFCKSYWLSDIGELCLKCGNNTTLLGR
jgi:hypothetical protein